MSLQPTNETQHVLHIGPDLMYRGLGVSATGPVPEGIRLQPLVQVVSDSCSEGCRVKVSCHSGSVRSAHSVQSALFVSHC